MSYVVLILFFIITGLLAGYSAGFFGIGGGCVTVPVLLTVFYFGGVMPPVLMKVAVATSLALAVPSCLVTSFQKYRQGHLDVRLFKPWFMALILGVATGLSCVHYVSGFFLKVFFTCYLLVAAVLVALPKKGLPSGGFCYPRWLFAIGGWVIGAISVMLGIGGGTFVVPFYEFSQYPMRQALGISSASGLTIGLFGAVSLMILGWHVSGLPHYSWGYVNGLAWVVMTPVAMYAARRGVSLAARCSDKKLQYTYVAFLLGMAVYMAMMTAFVHL